MGDQLRTGGNRWGSEISDWNAPEKRKRGKLQMFWYTRGRRHYVEYYEE